MNGTRRWIFFLAAGLIVTWFAYGTVSAQGNRTHTGNDASPDERVHQVMLNAGLAESVVALRESATGRSFDPAYRVSLKKTLASLPATQLESIWNAGGEGSLVSRLIGDSSADLIYTPVPPCRLFDTRYSTAGILVGDTQRNFIVAGSGILFENQGGNSAGCGIPYGPATSAVINFAAVAPTGAGNLRAWAVSTPQTAAPLAAVMNFSPAMHALANGVVVPICDPATTTCSAGGQSADLRLQADFGSVHVVGDVVGYFRKLDLPTAMPMGSEKLDSFTTVSGWQYAVGTVDVYLPHNGTCLVTCNLDVESAAQNNTGYLFFRTARRNVGDATMANDEGWGMDVSTPSIWSSGSTTYAWNMTGGVTYRFGCHIDATGDFIGETAYTNISWVCR